MRTISWPKKRRWNKKGMSSVVGAMFMILIVGMIASGYFMFTLAQNTTYNDAMRSNNNAEVVRMSESVKIPSAATYNAESGKIRVSVTLQNDGPIGVQIKTLWIKSTTNNNYGFEDNLNIALSPGESVPLNKLVTTNEAIETDNWYGWIITAKGRTFELYPDHGMGPQGLQGDTGSIGVTGPIGQTGPQGPQGSTSYDANTALISQGIGSISMDFKSYASFVVDGSNQLGSANPSYTFSLSAKTAFKVTVKNMDSSQAGLTLTHWSQIWIFAPSQGAIKGEAWPLATVTDNVITPLGSNNIFLPYNVSTTLYFGPFKPGGSSLNVGITAVNLVLNGEVGTLGYGQNLPFISLIATA